MQSLIDKYGKELLTQIAEDYGIETTYIDSETGAEVEYTTADILGALGLGEETDVSAALSGNIQTAFEEKELEGITPTLKITDEMLCAIMDSQMDGVTSGLSDYAVDFRKLAIEKEDVGGLEHTFIKMYFVFDIAALSGNSGTVETMMMNIMGGNMPVIAVRFDITEIDESNLVSPVLVLNGFDGTRLNGLTTERILQPLTDLTGFSTDDILSQMQIAINEAFSQMQSNSIVKMSFTESPERP